MIGIPEIYKPITGIHDYVDAGGEQTIIEITGSSRKFITGIMIDMVNITQNGTFKLYSKIDGTNYREIDSLVFTEISDSNGVLINTKIPVNIDFKLTYTESVDETDDRNMPYSYMLEG